MKDWNLYTKFKNGKEAGASWNISGCFGIIGLLVLTIASSISSSHHGAFGKRAREVGIRKAWDRNEKTSSFNSWQSPLCWSFSLFHFPFCSPKWRCRFQWIDAQPA